MTDPHISDPALLRDHSEFKAYRTSRFEYPEIRVFFREHAKVAITNGAACGEAGKQFVRFNMAMSRPMLEETVQKMAAAVYEFVPVM